MCRVRADLPLVGAHRSRVDTFGRSGRTRPGGATEAPHLPVPVAVPLRTPHTETYAYVGLATPCEGPAVAVSTTRDRKSTRLNSSHVAISYAVFCLKKKRNEINRLMWNQVLTNISPH